MSFFRKKPPNPPAPPAKTPEERLGDALAQGRLARKLRGDSLAKQLEIDRLVRLTQRRQALGRLRRLHELELKLVNRFTSRLYALQVQRAKIIREMEFPDEPQTGDEI